MHRRIGQARPAPTEHLDQEGGERPAHRTRKAAEQCKRGDGSPRLRAIQTAKRRKGGVVEAGAHAEADHHPCGEKQRKVRCQPERRETQRENREAAHQDAAPPMPADQLPNPRRGQARYEERDGEARDDEGQGPSGFGGEIGAAKTAGR